ncbi:MAG: hypothetical protein MK105_10675 [Crocinitomicaceae bacterium]|nr:hypothetical protein [Crocinitomicaceae bacterium]
MMRKVLFILFFFSSCGVPEFSKLDTCLKKLIKNNDCDISLEVENSKDLNLTYKCNPERSHFAGLILLDAYSIFRENELVYEVYRILDSNGLLLLELTAKEIELLFNKLETYKGDLNLIKKSNAESIYNRLCKALQDGVSKEQFSNDLVTLKFDDFNNFEGFTIEKIEDEDYIFFSNKNSSDNHLLLGYLFNEEQRIQGFTVE